MGSNTTLTIGDLEDFESGIVNTDYLVVEDVSTGQTVRSTIQRILSTAAEGDMTIAVYDQQLVEEQLAGLTAVQTMSNKTMTSVVLNVGVTGTAVLDEDTLVSNSDTKLATQQSIKAYVDSVAGAASTTTAGVVELATIAEMETGTSTTLVPSVDAIASMTVLTGIDWILDEDDFTSDSAAAVPTQQSAKAYADLMLPLAGGTMSGDITCADNDIIRANLDDCSETFTDNGNSSTTTQTLTYSTSMNYSITATGNHTVAFAGWPPTGTYGCMTLMYYDGGDYTITWPAEVDWATGVAPTLTANGWDKLIFETNDAGTIIRGSLAGAGYL